MRLEPYKRVDMRREKTVRHYYDAERERWCRVSNQPTAEWQDDWLGLQDLLELDRCWMQVESGSPEDEILTRGHGYWLTTAALACDDALEKGQTFLGSREDPYDRSRRILIANRTVYVGRGGVTVAAAKEDDQQILVTAFRVVPTDGDPDDHSLEDCEAAAVRKASRLASMLGDEDST